jgi:hypothetical protein
MAHYLTDQDTSELMSVLSCNYIIDLGDAATAGCQIPL